MSPRKRTLALVVLEEGGEWPSWLADLPYGIESRTVIMQDEGESCAGFAERVGRELEGIGSTVEMAVLACNERADERMLTVRRRLARAIVPLFRSGAGDLFFTESERQSGGSRLALSTLASDLALEWEDSGVRVSVRFGQPSRMPIEPGARREASSRVPDFRQQP
jgi:hypothetical protein